MRHYPEIEIDISQDTKYYKFLLKLSVINNKTSEKNWFKSLKILEEMNEFETDMMRFSEKKLMEKGFRGLTGNKDRKHHEKREFEIPEEMKRTVPKSEN